MQCHCSKMRHFHLTQKNTHYLIAHVEHQWLALIILLKFTGIPTEQAHDDNKSVRISRSKSSRSFNISIPSVSTSIELQAILCHIKWVPHITILVLLNFWRVARWDKVTCWCNRGWPCELSWNQGRHNFPLMLLQQVSPDPSTCHECKMGSRHAWKKERKKER